MDRSEIRTIVETAIDVDDLDAAEAFSLDVLGLEVIGREAGRHIFFRLGDGVRLTFNPEDARAVLGGGKAWLAKGDQARALHDFEEGTGSGPTTPCPSPAGTRPGAASLNSPLLRGRRRVRLRSRFLVE